MNLLDIPLGYLTCQWILGAMNARDRCMREHVDLRNGMRVLDVGCGPGYVVALLAGESQKC